VGSGVRLVKEKLNEAEEEFEIEYAEYLEKQGRDDSDTPLFSYLTSWLAMVKATIQPTTYRSYSNMINGKIKKWFDKPNITLGSITGRQINQFYQSFFDDGLKANTAIHYHSVLHKAFKHAVKNDMILVNPCEKADRPKKNKFRGKYYSQEELQTLLALSKDDIIYIPIVLAAYYGLRRSEVIGLCWSRVDFERKIIRIELKAIDTSQGRNEEPVLSDIMKNESSRRSLPLIPEVEEILTEHKQKQEMYQKLFKKGYNKKNLDVICTDPQGNILRLDYVTDHFRALLAKYGLRCIRFHDLRHTCASLLIANKVNLKAIQEWLGHSTFSTTADIYAHLDWAAKEESADVISRILSKPID
jgi:integrase